MTLTALWHSPVQHFSAGLFVPLEQLWQMCVIITWATPAQDSSQIIACPQRKHTHLTLALWTCHSTWKVPLWSIMLYAKRFKFSCTQWTVTLSNLDVVKCLSQTGKTFPLTPDCLHCNICLLNNRSHSQHDVYRTSLHCKANGTIRTWKPWIPSKYT